MITGCLFILISYIAAILSFIVEFALQVFKLVFYMAGIVLIAAIVSLIFRL